MGGTHRTVPWRATDMPETHPALVPEPSIWPDEIRAYRGAMGFSQRQLAHALGVHPDTVASWESGKNVPMNEGLLRLALEALLSPSSDYVRAVLLVASHSPR